MKKREERGGVWFEGLEQNKKEVALGRGSRKEREAKRGKERKMEEAGHVPLLSEKGGPRDGEGWTARLKEEYRALIAMVKHHKENGTEWFKIEATDKTGTTWQVRSAEDVWEREEGEGG